jgi:hypothetical protein
MILDSAVGRARVCCDAVRWRGATTQRATARKEKQQCQRAVARRNRVRSALTQMVNWVEATHVSGHRILLVKVSGQLPNLG